MAINEIVDYLKNTKYKHAVTLGMNLPMAVLAAGIGIEAYVLDDNITLLVSALVGSANLTGALAAEAMFYINYVRKKDYCI